MTSGSDARNRLRRYLEYLERDPANLRLIAEATDLCVELRQLAQARELVKKGLTSSGNAAEFRYRLSCIALAECDWEQVVEVSRALLQEGEDHLAVHYNLGAALAMLGRHAEAKKHLCSPASRAESFPDAPLFLVNVLHHLGELDEASRIAQAHLAAHAADAAIAGTLSTVCLDREDFAAARQWSDQALRYDPHDANALTTHGMLALIERNTDSAEKAFDRAIEREPTVGRPRLGRAISRMLRSDLKGARADFEEAVKRMPEHIGSWQGLAWSQLLDGDAPAAEKSYRKSLELNRNFAESHGGLALAAAMQGRWDDVGILATKALRLDRTSFSGRFAQALLLQKDGDTPLAQARLREVLEAAREPSSEALRALMAGSSPGGKI